MPYGKTAMRFIDSAPARAAKYAKRSKGLQKKAEELATLCGVQVALVCVNPDAGAKTSTVVWESEEGVLDRYRALPPEVRARHTHGDYLLGELSKQRAKLARVQQDGPGALACWDAALNDMTLDEARELLGTIDAALRATSDRLHALGLPADGGNGPVEQIAPGATDAVMPVMPLLGHGVVPCTTGSNLADMIDAGFQLQMMPGGGNNSNFDGQLEHVTWDDRFQLNNAEMAQPGQGFQCIGGEYTGATDGYQMQAPGYGNAHYGWPELTMWHTHTDESSCHAILPVGCYPSLGIGGTPAPEHSALGTGGVYSYAPPLTFAMGVGGNFTSQDGYAAHWSADEFQCADVDTGSGSGTSQAAAPPQCSDPGTRGSSQVFHYYL